MKVKRLLVIGVLICIVILGGYYLLAQYNQTEHVDSSYIEDQISPVQRLFHGKNDNWAVTADFTGKIIENQGMDWELYCTIEFINEEVNYENAKLKIMMNDKGEPGFNSVQTWNSKKDPSVNLYTANQGDTSKEIQKYFSSEEISIPVTISINGRKQTIIAKEFKISEGIDIPQGFAEAIGKYATVQEIINDSIGNPHHEPKNPLAIVNGQIYIELDEFQLRKDLRIGTDPDNYNDEDLLKTLIREKVVQYEAIRLGVYPSDEEINAYIDDQRYNSNEEIDEAIALLIEAAGISEEGYWNGYEKYNVIRMLIEQNVFDAFVTVREASGAEVMRGESLDREYEKYIQELVKKANVEFLISNEEFR